MPLSVGQTKELTFHLVFWGIARLRAKWFLRESDVASLQVWIPFETPEQLLIEAVATACRRSEGKTNILDPIRRAAFLWDFAIEETGMVLVHDKASKTCSYLLCSPLPEFSGGQAQIYLDNNHLPDSLLKIYNGSKTGRSALPKSAIVEWAVFRFFSGMKGIPRLLNYGTVYNPTVQKFTWSTDVVRYSEIEYIRGCTLRDLLSCSSIRQEDAKVAALFVIENVAAFLDEWRQFALTHGGDFVHGDVAPRNIIISDRGAVYLIDFSASLLKTSAGEEISETAFTVGYSPLEAQESFQGSDSRTVSTDVFSLACCFFECMSGKKVYDIISDRYAVWRYLSCLSTKPESLNSIQDDSLRFFFEQALDPIQKKRPKMRELLEMVRKVRRDLGQGSSPDTSVLQEIISKCVDATSKKNLDDSDIRVRSARVNNMSRVNCNDFAAMFDRSPRSERRWVRWRLTAARMSNRLWWFLPLQVLVLFFLACLTAFYGLLAMWSAMKVHCFLIGAYLIFELWGTFRPRKIEKAIDETRYANLEIIPGTIVD